MSASSSISDFPFSSNRGGEQNNLERTLNNFHEETLLNQTNQGGNSYPQDGDREIPLHSTPVPAQRQQRPRSAFGALPRSRTQTFGTPRNSRYLNFSLPQADQKQDALERTVIMQERQGERIDQLVEMVNQLAAALTTQNKPAPNQVPPQNHNSGGNGGNNAGNNNAGNIPNSSSYTNQPRNPVNAVYTVGGTVISESGMFNPIRNLENFKKDLRMSNSSILKADANTYEKWSKYLESIFQVAGLHSFSKMNVYQMPAESTWEQWDSDCLSNVGGKIPASTYRNFLSKIANYEEIVSYFDTTDNKEKSFDRNTNMDILNCAVQLTLNKWPGLKIVLYQTVKHSIDYITMASVIELDASPTFTELRRMYMKAKMFHLHNSEEVIMIKIEHFQSDYNFRMDQHESPIAYLKRLKEEAAIINALENDVNNYGEPLNQRMLKRKFMRGIYEQNYYQQKMHQLKMGVLKLDGTYRPLTLDEFADQLHLHYLERRERSMAQGRAKGFAAKEGNSDSEDETSFALQENPKEQGICFSMRDTGKCKYGDKCKYSHKAKIAQKAYLSTHDRNRILQQELENERLLSAQALQEQKDKYAQRVKFYKSNFHKKKMEKYKQKLGDKNKKGSGDRANLAEEDPEQKDVEEEKEESVAGNPSEPDEVSDLDKSE